MPTIQDDAPKRTLDIISSVIGLVLASPLLAAISALIWVRMGRPVLFKQERTGKGGQLFVLYKFRTMDPVGMDHADSTSDADRITPLGRFLRKMTLDELPELWNVLRGEMSLVGPRPLLPRYLDRYSERQARRLEVTPGLTSWAVVKGRNRLGWDERLELDVWYVENRTFLLDIKILWLTLLKVLRREDVSHEGHATMPEFQGERESGP